MQRQTTDVPASRRSWQEVARELTCETDTQKMLVLMRKSSDAYDEQRPVQPSSQPLDEPKKNTA
jgi:hypothetical protein